MRARGVPSDRLEVICFSIDTPPLAAVCGVAFSLFARVVEVRALPCPATPRYYTWG